MSPKTGMRRRRHRRHLTNRKELESVTYGTYPVVGFGEAPRGHPASPNLPFVRPSRRLGRTKT